MNRPDKEYRCLLGIHEPLIVTYTAEYKYDASLNQVPTTAADAMGCTNILGTHGKSPYGILISKPFREGSEAIVEYYNNGVPSIISLSLYEANASVPRLLLLPPSVTRVAYNLVVEDMGYDSSWYEGTDRITDACDKDAINGLGLFLMYDARPYYSQLQLSKEQDANASSGRFLRDNVQTDLTFRAEDYEAIVEVSEYATCAVVFLETFDNFEYNNIAACLCFDKAGAEISMSECYVKPNLKALDAYTYLLDKYSAQKNIVGLSIPTKPVTFPVPPVIQLYVTGSMAVTNICGDSCWEQEVDSSISMNDLRKAGFLPVNGSKIISELPNMVTNRALNISLQRVRSLGLDRYIHYGLNITTGEYLFETTENYNEEPTDEFPYDILRFRYQNGAVEYYNPQNGRVFARYPYAGLWPPLPNGFATGVNDFVEAGGLWWGAFSNNYDANVGVWGRIVCHDPEGTDSYAISRFAPLTKWYNKLAYPIDYDFGHYLPWSDKLLFKQTNLHVKKPTEYGIYQPDLYYTNEDLSIDSYLSGLKPLPFAKSWWGEYSYWVDLVGQDVDSWLGSFTRTVRVNDCYAIADVLTALLKSYGVPYSFSASNTGSALIYGTTLPNYLKCIDLVLTPASNITRGRYTQAAQKGMISLKDLLDEVCSMANAGWHIDYSGLHIEGREYYDRGHSYQGMQVADLDFDFESVIDEFNDTNVLYGQIAHKPDVDNLWHTLELGGGEQSTRHFATTQMQAKAIFCKKSESVTKSLAYDLLSAIAIDGAVGNDEIVMLGITSKYNIVGQITIPVWYVSLDASSIVEVKVDSTSAPVASRILNRALSWPYLKGRQCFGLPSDKSLVEFGWMQISESLATMARSYTRPHRHIDIRMPVVSRLFTLNWSFVKTTVGYGVVSGMKIDLISRVADISVDILEYNL